MTNTTNQNQSGTNTTTSKPADEYINVHFSGSPLVYVYAMTDIFNEKTGKTTHFFKGNMQVGKKSDKNFQPVEGTLSDYAYKVLSPLMLSINSTDLNAKRSVGITCKTPRFEGTTAFQPKTGNVDPATGLIPLVSVLRMRINTIDDCRVFQKQAS